ncbi:MAG: hypothetical protein GX638_13905, partial [Crenarchaeota archaeon]|nr:hypothetical protein [Thermoproteota archaeon]
QTSETHKLWKSGNKSYLIKVGAALLIFPEPIASGIAGSSLIAIGAIQQRIKNQSIYLDDLPKAFKGIMKEIRDAKDLLY